jgi:thiol-disulfide isomerase/thioredoxin
MFASSILRIAALAAAVSIVESFATNGSITVTKHGVTPLTSLQAIANPFKSEEKDKGKKKTGRANVLHVESIKEFKEEVADEREKITVVRFYSRACKSCQASEPLFYKLASDFEKYGVKFVEVPQTPNTKVLHDALEVPSLPWTHIYHPDAGLVEERKVSKKFIDEVRNCLRCYVYGECDLADAPAGCMDVYGECAVDDEDGMQ